MLTSSVGSHVCVQHTEASQRQGLPLRKIFTCWRLDSYGKCIHESLLSCRYMTCNRGANCSGGGQNTAIWLDSRSKRTSFGKVFPWIKLALEMLLPSTSNMEIVFEILFILGNCVSLLKPMCICLIFTNKSKYESLMCFMKFWARTNFCSVDFTSAGSGGKLDSRLLEISNVYNVFRPLNAEGWMDSKLFLFRYNSWKIWSPVIAISHAQKYTHT